MSNAEASLNEVETEETKPRGKKGLVVGLILALMLGGGAFYAVYSGLILGPAEVTGQLQPGQGVGSAAEDSAPPVSFVSLEPLVISLGPKAGSRHLRFRADLEVTPGQEDYVSKLTPRVMDVLNSYLRAVDLNDLVDPSALIELRAQMLRRIQLVTGNGRVRDLLILEFVMS